MQASNVAEDYSIRSPLTGDAEITRLVLTGWGGVTSAVPALETWTDRGRLWWTFTAATNVLQFYRKPTLLSGDKVCAGTATAGVIATLAADGSSPISGSCECSNGTLGTNPAQNSTGHVVVSYAHENDLVDAYAGVASYLDSNSKWLGQNTRFEAILRNAKRQLDEHVAGALGARIRLDSKGRRQLADIADPRQLAPVHARWTLALIEEFRKRYQDATYWRDQAMSLLRGTRITLDYDADANQDVEANVSSAILVRA